MKVAILWRGPIRPTAEDVIKTIELLKGNIESQGHQVDGYYLTWLDKDIKVLAERLPWLNLIAIKEPDKDLALGKLTARCRTVNLPNHHWTPENNYKQFWATRVGIKFIEQTLIPYDCMILSRPDLEVTIDSLASWFANGVYTMPDVAVYNNFCDQFAICQAQTALHVWDTEDLQRLNSLYGSSENPEEVLRKIAESNGIKVGFKHPTLYSIRGQRFV